MEKVKFKVWDKKEKKLVAVSDIDFTGNIVFLENYSWYYLKDVILLQFTGLLDKYGKEIYESNIVRNQDGRIGYITFLPQEAGFVVVYENSDTRLLGHRNTGSPYGQEMSLEVLKDNCIYIGQQDKFGRAIYVGCIVLTDEGRWVAEVVANNDQDYLEYPFICVDPYGGYSCACNWKEYEIIGDAETYDWNLRKLKK